jgi:hypothetical protein
MNRGDEDQEKDNTEDDNGEIEDEEDDFRSVTDRYGTVEM